MKERSGGGEFNEDLVRIVNATMYSHPGQQQKINKNDILIF
jgi:hypothetical protein